MKKLFIPIFLLLTACQTKTSNPVQIVIDRKQKSVKVTGVPETALNGIKNDTLSLQAWQSLFPVCTMPADTEMRNYQEPLKGDYVIKNGFITFKPDTAFKTGQTYFARYYRYDEQIKAVDLVTHQREPGKARYTELIFKY
jgi:hypothetical protein